MAKKNTGKPQSKGHSRTTPAAKRSSVRATITIRQTTQRRQKRQPLMKPTQITPMQMELLDMFAHKNLTRKEVDEIKDLLSDYFLEKAQDELEELAEEKGWDLKEKSKEWGKEKFRIPYRRDRNS